jgi:glycosyl transferase family 87
MTITITDAHETITDAPLPPPPRPAGPGLLTALRTAPGAGLWSWPGRRRVWALYAAFALYAGAVAVFSGPGDDRSWGIWAAFGYAAAAALAAVWPGRAGRLAALAASLAGALAAPVVWLATQASPTPDVHVVGGSAVLLLHHGTAYLDPAQLAHGNVLSYNPYLPVMTIFGLPHALGLPGLAGDTRPWLVLATFGLLAAALRITSPAGTTRGAALGLAAFATASPVLAFPLAEGITDPPMIALTVLALALLTRSAARIWPAALVLGAACAMKYTAWPALVVLAAMLAARDGRRAAARFAGLTCATTAALTAALAPAALAAPAGLIHSTVLFPLGLTPARSPAQSPLPGHALATLGPAGHHAAIALLIISGLALAASLVIRPPRDAPAAARRIALGLALMFALSPVTRFGYFAYPIALYAWAGLGRGGRPDQPDPATRLSAPGVAGMPALGEPAPPGRRPAPAR